jgi:hypothetical protein
VRLDQFDRLLDTIHHDVEEQAGRVRMFQRNTFW